MSSKVKLPKGTRDFLPSEMMKRNYIFSIIKEVFHKFGFDPIETPAMEDLTTLTGKYGEEGDRLIFKILNNGDFLSKVDEELLRNKNSLAVTEQLSKRALRYDLTVPFARYVVMHQNELQFPFKRYQIQPVWRADRPQKGRYQEFYQCDIDVIGSDSLIYEAELAQIYLEVFDRLGIDIELRMNHREIILGMASHLGVAEKVVHFTTIIDKIDKIGLQGVLNTLIEELDFDADQIEKTEQLLTLKELGTIEELLKDDESAVQGIRELRKVFHWVNHTTGKTPTFDISLARGLNYYTGCIYEVQAKDVEMGSIGGGGRYDKLTEIFGLKNMSGVGISFGAERIYDVMEELELFPQEVNNNDVLLCIALDEQSLDHSFGLISRLRSNGIRADLYPDVVKMKKSMKYADARGYAHVLIIGESERTSGQYSVKNMTDGSQREMDEDGLMEYFYAG